MVDHFDVINLVFQPLNFRELSFHEVKLTFALSCLQVAVPFTHL